MNSRRYKKLLRPIVLISATVLAFSQITGAFAFITYGHWANFPSVVYYAIHPGLDSNLGVTGAFNLAAYNVVPQWNKASWFGLTRFVPYDPNGTGLTTADFSSPYIPDLCLYAPNDRTTLAVTCADSSNITKARTYLNNSGTWQWNTSGNMNCSAHQADVLTIELHEFGHILGLDDEHGSTHPEAVENFNCTTKQILMPDDRDGATQIYGPRTSFDWSDGYALGETNNVAYAQSVAGYYYPNSVPSPELGNRHSEFSVTPVAGGRMEMMSGYSRTTSAYMYFRLFTYQNENGGPHQSNYIKV